MTKVGKSHSKGTFAGAFGNDEDAPHAAIPRDNASLNFSGAGRVHLNVR
jgi:hypothetical protein